MKLRSEMTIKLGRTGYENTLFVDIVVQLQ